MSIIIFNLQKKTLIKQTNGRAGCNNKIQSTYYKT